MDGLKYNNMKICQVTTGMIPVRPVGEMGWGAVEKIVREYKISLEKLGHEVDIKHLNEVEPNQYDFVHCHMGNLALELFNRGIPYVFSLHDHHTEHYGKDSYCFRHNLDAMKKSIFAITHAEYLVDYFDETDKLFYLSHAVNTSFFTPAPERPAEHRLLMVANNGLAGDYGFDRKGFRYGVEAARELDLPITIVGTDANQRFFDIHKDIAEYPKLNLIARNPTENELLQIYHQHTIFLHPSMLEAGHPNLTLKEAASCALPMVATYRGSEDINGLWKLNEITTNAVIEGIRRLMQDYDMIRAVMLQFRESHDWIHTCKTLSKMYYAVSQFHNFDSDTITRKYKDVYSNTVKI
jgi:glycosyltransferase involved in cell wall biosynthesis